MPDLFINISDHIQQATGRRFRLENHRPLAGGCINRSEVMEGDDGLRFFVKLNNSSLSNMFDVEAEGLRALKAACALRIPGPVCAGVWQDTAYLVLEFIDLARAAGTETHSALGRGLATLHRATSDRFGWHLDNTIGSTPQINSWCDHWIDFFREMRMSPQLRLAYDNGIGRQTLSAGENLLQRLDEFFTGYMPIPSLLHGDLWGGNFAADTAGEPVIFDPAPYFGDREADLAMTELFGGFGRAFYEAYNADWPLDDGYKTRKKLYNLYHVLNHFNLFGGGYSMQARGMIHDLLADPNPSV